MRQHQIKDTKGCLCVHPFSYFLLHCGCFICTLTLQCDMDAYYKIYQRPNALAKYQNEYIQRATRLDREREDEDEGLQ